MQIEVLILLFKSFYKYVESTEAGYVYLEYMRSRSLKDPLTTRKQEEIAENVGIAGRESVAH